MLCFKMFKNVKGITKTNKKCILPLRTNCYSLMVTHLLYKK